MSSSAISGLRRPNPQAVATSTEALRAVSIVSRRVIHVRLSDRLLTQMRLVRTSPGSR